MSLDIKQCTSFVIFFFVTLRLTIPQLHSPELASAAAGEKIWAQRHQDQTRISGCSRMSGHSGEATIYRLLLPS